MAATSLLARLGLRVAVLGSAASLSVAAPLAEGDVSQAAHTDASRIGMFFDRTPAAEKVGVVVMGSEKLSIGVSTVSANADLNMTGYLYKSSALFLHNRGTNCLFLGVGAGNLTFTVGSVLHAVAVGDGAMSAVSVNSSFSTAVGMNSLKHGGLICTAIGHTVMGGAAATGNQQCTAVGAGSMFDAINSQFNVAVGDNCLKVVDGTGVTRAGKYNTAVGSGTLTRVTVGADNVAVGSGAGFAVTTGSRNVYVGTGAGAAAPVAQSDCIVLGNGAASNIDFGCIIGNPASPILTGIGTGTPTSKLHVVTTAALVGTIVKGAAAQTAPLSRWVNNTDVSVIDAWADGCLRIGAGASSSLGAEMLGFVKSSIGIPSILTRSAGTRIVLFNGLTAATSDYAIGVGSSVFWLSIPAFNNTNEFSFYAAGTKVAAISGIGNTYSSHGTALLPAWSFLLDTSTGLYRPALNTIGVSTAGVERARFYADGGVQIGGTFSAGPGPGALMLGGAGGGTAGIKCIGTGALTPTVLTLPTTNGAAGNALITDGAGVTSWSAISGGSSYYEATVADEAAFTAAVTAAEASTASDVMLYVTSNITFLAAVPTLTKKYTIQGNAAGALTVGLKPTLTRTVGATWFTVNGGSLWFVNVGLTYGGAGNMVTADNSENIACDGCDISISNVGFYNEFQGNTLIDLTNCRVLNTSAAPLISISRPNTANLMFGQAAVTLTGCDIQGFVVSIINSGKVTCAVVSTRITDGGQGCWRSTQAGAGAVSELIVTFNSLNQVARTLVTGSTQPITFTDIAFMQANQVYYGSAANVPKGNGGFFYTEGTGRLVAGGYSGGVGTASSPTYNFSGAGGGGTGMYRPSTDALGLCANGTEAIRIFSNLGVQIGGSSFISSPGLYSLSCPKGVDSSQGFGFSALLNNTATDCTAVGFMALTSNSTGVSNTAVGSRALDSNTFGTNNTAVGSGALDDLTGGSNFNTAVGADAGGAITVFALNNTAIGARALLTNTTGSDNVALGYNACETTALTNRGVFLGVLSRPAASSQTNQIVIGFDAIGAGSNTATLGNDNIIATYLKGNVYGNGALNLPSIQTAISQTLNSTHFTVAVDASAGPVTITLPSTATAGVPGRIYNIKKIDATANAVTIQRSGADTIDGAVSTATTIQYVTRTVQARAVGAAWDII